MYYYYVLFLIFLRLCLGELVTEHNIYKKKKKTTSIYKHGSCEQIFYILYFFNKWQYTLSYNIILNLRNRNRNQRYSNYIFYRI